MGKKALAEKKRVRKAFVEAAAEQGKKRGKE